MFRALTSGKVSFLNSIVMPDPNEGGDDEDDDDDEEEEEAEEEADDGNSE